MNNELLYALGVMSGTSLDGLDIVYCSFDVNNLSKFQIIDYETYNYDSSWKLRLKNAIHSNKDEIDKLDDNYGVFLGEKINQFVNNKDIDHIDFIASHGHTIFHKPLIGITKQIGNGEKISEITGLKVVCDFRTQDVKLGGQGAPLVPIGDRLLFSKYDACLNLGGFANISFEKNNERIAFDICPANIVLNYYCRVIDLDFDNEGELASKGKINKELLQQLNELKFYQQLPPKSLGLEWVLENIIPLINSFQLTIKDILRTFVEHIAIQIAGVLNDKKTVFVTGGGVYNKFFIKSLEEKTDCKIIIPEKALIEYKEALIFALLGLLKIQGKVNCLKSVTGAKKNHSSGIIFQSKAIL